jgi:hypothetical protein
MYFECRIHKERCSRTIKYIKCFQHTLEADNYFRRRYFYSNICNIIYKIYLSNSHQVAGQTNLQDKDENSKMKIDQSETICC